jgi:hypothetical protein
LQEIPKGTEYLVLHSRERRYGINPERLLNISCPLVLEGQHESDSQSTIF